MKCPVQCPVLVSVPNLGWIHKKVCHATDVIRADGRFSVRFIQPTHRPFENNLHHIVRNFLSGDEEFWLNIDSDNPPNRNPLDLIKLDLDIVGCPTPVMHYTGTPGEIFYYWNAYKRKPGTDGYTEYRPCQGLQKVDAVGTGCTLFSRRVFDDPRLQRGPFERKKDKYGRVNKGNDIAFCERATKAGFTIWAHYDYPCDHVHEIFLNDMIRGHVGAMEFHGKRIR